MLQVIPDSTATDDSTDAPGSQDSPSAPGTGTPPAGRLMIPLGLLEPHPDNVRADLDLNPAFIASFAEDGILVPLRIVPREDTAGYWVIDGSRRLAGAARAGLAEAPCDLAAGRQGDRAGQFLDMVTTSRHRTALRPAEEAAALFAAHQAGAPKTRLRKATGLPAAEINTALTAGTLSADTRAQAAAVTRDLTLDELAVLAEFDNDPEAITRLTRAAEYGQLDHEAELIRTEHAEQAEQQRQRDELEATGYAVTGELPDGAEFLSALMHDATELTIETHAGCPGRGAVFFAWAPAQAVHYCTSPAAYDHCSRHQRNGIPDSLAGTSGHTQPDPAQAEADRRARQLVIDGNRAWHAAANVRHRWLTGLLNRKTAPPAVARFLAAQLIQMPEPLQTYLPRARSLPLFTTLTGINAAQLLPAARTYPASRLPLLMLVPVATAYEHAMTEGDAAKATWRPDRYSPCPTSSAGHYLAFLASLGYQLSAIEQAVADQVPYTGEDPGTARPEPAPVTPPGDIADGDAHPDDGDDCAAAEPGAAAA